MTVVERTQQLRWSDSDALGHVWHGTYVSLFEEVRTAWLAGVCGRALALEHVVVHLELDFRGELRYADEVATLSCRGDGFGRSSVRTYEQARNGAGELVADARSVVVAFGNGASRLLTEAERSALEAAQ